MEVIALDLLAKMAGVVPNDNMRSMKVALDKYGHDVGLDRPHRLAQFLPQILHESGNFRYDREIWGNTAAQKRYDTRTDLGNTPAKDGDGKKNAGRGPIQVTGAYNIGRYYDWCVAQKMSPPDFRANPDLINTDPWEGLSAIWYWSVGNPTGKSLNAYADEANIEAITKKINGGLNGYDDRIAKYVRCALVLLGYGPTAIEAFQRTAQRDGLLPKDEPGKPSQVDGDAGPKTRSALHMALVALDGGRSLSSDAVKAAPVTEETKVEVPVAVVPEGADKRGTNWLMAGIGIISPGVSAFFAYDLTTKLIFGGIGIVAIAIMIWRGEVIIGRIKKLVAEING